MFYLLSLFKICLGVRVTVREWVKENEMYLFSKIIAKFTYVKEEKIK